MSDGSSWILLIAFLPLILLAFSPDDSVAHPVPFCTTEEEGHRTWTSESNSQSFKTMDRLIQRGWTNVHRVQHAFTDTIHADCEVAP